MNKKAQTKLDQLKLALHGVTAPFSCEGTFVPDKPVTLVFKDNTRFEVVRAKNSFDQEREMGPLLAHCQAAPFGAGKKTRYDRSVRDALQLKAEGGAFRVENFDPESAGLLKEIQRGLVPHDPSPIAAELYSLNVYVAGGHFAPHKDTPRGNDMFGTLVVCLPAQFGNGKFVLTHRGIVQKFDWGSSIEAQKEAGQLHWAAFFGDVDHQIERIWFGARVTLTYLLKRGAGGEPARNRFRRSGAARPGSLARLAYGSDFPAEGRRPRLSMLSPVPSRRAFSAKVEPDYPAIGDRAQGTRSPGGGRRASGRVESRLHALHV